MKLPLLLILLPAALAAATPAGGFLKKSDDWFRGTDGRKATECVLSWQSQTESWPKNTDTTRKKFSGDRAKIKGTFDNSATTDELRFLARAFRATGNKRCQAAFFRGLDCILECQIIVRGTPTVWCAQHNETTLAPAPARSYELRSLSGSESAGTLRFLMSLEHPSPRVIRAVHGGVAWFESAKITGIRLVKTDGDRKIIRDASAPPLWARFYEIETNQPFFCGRDGVKKSQLAEIEAERRNGYAWYGNWGESVAKEFAKWPHATKPAKR